MPLYKLQFRIFETPDRDTEGKYAYSWNMEIADSSFARSVLKHMHYMHLHTERKFQMHFVCKVDALMTRLKAIIDFYWN